MPRFTNLKDEQIDALVIMSCISRSEANLSVRCYSSGVNDLDLEKDRIYNAAIHFRS